MVGHLTFYPVFRGWKHEHVGHLTCEFSQKLEARTPWSFDVHHLPIEGLYIVSGETNCQSGSLKGSSVIEHLHDYKKRKFGTRSCASINFTIHTRLTSHSSLPDNAWPQGQTRERCLRPEIRSKALVGSWNWRCRRSSHQSQKRLGLYNLLTEFCIWLPLSLIVKVEQVDENHRRQHVCSSSPAFSSYYISNSGGSRINALASSVMVSTPSNHREREKPGIISLMPGLRKCEQNWAKDRIWSGGLGTRITSPI